MFNREIYGHRGASARAFENTIQAFQQAVREGADGIEIDVQLSKDGVPIVIHDRNLSRLASRNRVVDHMNLRSIQRVKLGNIWQRRFQQLRISPLKEVAHFCEVHGLGLNVEIKETVVERPEKVRQIVELVAHLPQLHISSFHYEIIEEVKRVNASIETAQLLTKKDFKNKQLEHYVAADRFHLNKKFWTPAHVVYLEKIGKSVRVYDLAGDEELLVSDHPLLIGWMTDYIRETKAFIASHESTVDLS